jgi:hypothetical protein
MQKALRKVVELDYRWVVQTVERMVPLLAGLSVPLKAAQMAATKEETMADPTAS